MKQYKKSDLEILLKMVIRYEAEKESGVNELMEMGFSIEDMRAFGLPDEKVPGNTLIEYLYRDGSNYKKYSEAVVSGTLDEKEVLEIWECLEYGELFLPAQVGLPDDNRYSGTEDDHPWFELERI